MFSLFSVSYEENDEEVIIKLKLKGFRPADKSHSANATVSDKYVYLCNNTLPIINVLHIQT